MPKMGSLSRTGIETEDLDPENGMKTALVSMGFFPSHAFSKEIIFIMKKEHLDHYRILGAKVRFGRKLEKNISHRAKRSRNAVNDEHIPSDSIYRYDWLIKECLRNTTPQWAAVPSKPRLKPPNNELGPQFERYQKWLR
ncbi:unnamed protein product [Heligmosomoides polygyrus]|uniref:Uncharacterized protein n=1 Tax=Heligmosomoides polygyrus TaxID=6339 RepID=A0A183GMN3_HELPZ|nr:unnamed protein product [Heligmosomoides polygyrus]